MNEPHDGKDIQRSSLGHGPVPLRVDGLADCARPKEADQQIRRALPFAFVGFSGERP